MIQECKDYIVVKAHKIDKTHIYYKCPFCWKIRNGRILDSPFCKTKKRIYSSARPNEHFHGSGGDLGARIEYRTSHCTINNEKEIKIIIDEETKGCISQKPKTLKCFEKS